MATNLNVVGGEVFGAVSQTAGTVIQRVIPPRLLQGSILKALLTSLVYTAQGTAHTLTLMKCVARTTVASAAAASQAVVNITADCGVGSLAGAIAPDDYLVIEKPDGTWHLGKVSSITSLAVTLTANVPTGGFAAGAKVFLMGAVADTHGGIKTLAGTASVTTTFTGDAIVESPGPIVIESNNATAAGTIVSAAVSYAK